jgi:hypothetical protein
MHVRKEWMDWVVGVLAAAPPHFVDGDPVRGSIEEEEEP